MLAFNLIFTSLPITVLAVYDKDVTYEYIMTDQEETEQYRDHDFKCIDLDNSHIPSSTVKIMPLIKNNFQYLYHTTQQNWDFNWRVFFIEIINSVAIAVILCTLTFSVCSGTSIQHQDGYTYDFWMASFVIYGCLIYITNLVLIMRSGQITWFVMFWIAFFSIIPFLVLSLLFDTVMSVDNGSQYILLNMGSTYHYYLVCFIMTFIAFYFECVRCCIRIFWYPRLSDYYKLLIKCGKQNDLTKFDKDYLQSFAELNNPIQKRKLDKMRRASMQVGDGRLHMPSGAIDPVRSMAAYNSGAGQKESLEEIENSESMISTPQSDSNAFPILPFKKKNSAQKLSAKNSQEARDLRSSQGLQRPMLQSPLAVLPNKAIRDESLPPLTLSQYSNLKSKNSGNSVTTNKNK